MRARFAVRLERVLLTAVVALGVTGCATYEWTKPGVPAALAEQDEIDCARQAQSLAWDYETWLRHRAWMWGSPYGGYPFGRPWGWRDPFWPAMDPGWRFDLERHLSNRCMEAKGYSLMKVPDD